MTAKNNKNQTDAGFTLVELLVMIATLAILTAMVLPALASGKPNNQAAQCLNNLRRLATAWNMFPSDNSGEIMKNPGWAGGFMDWTPGATSTSPLIEPQQSAIANFVKSPSLFKCPADVYRSASQAGPRARSVSLNGALAGIGGGSGPSVKGFAPGGGRYYGSGSQGAGGAVRILSQLIKPGPAQTFLILDEHADSINDATFMHDPGYSPGAEVWRDLPASYHNRGGSISFVDGRAEIHQWRESTSSPNRTIYPVTMSGTTPWKLVTMNSSDYKWVQSHMPYVE